MVRDFDKYYAMMPFTREDADCAHEKLNEYIDEYWEKTSGEEYIRGLAQFVLETFTTNERLALVLGSKSLRRNWPQYFKEDGSVVV